MVGKVDSAETVPEGKCLCNKETCDGKVICDGDRQADLLVRAKEIEEGFTHMAKS